MPDYKDRYLLLKELIKTSGLIREDIAKVVNAMDKIDEEENKNKKEEKGE